MSPAPAPVTVIVEAPAGVEALVLIVRVVEHAGSQDGEEKEAVAPVGRPETMNETV